MTFDSDYIQTHSHIFSSIAAIEKYLLQYNLRLDVCNVFSLSDTKYGLDATLHGSGESFAQLQSLEKSLNGNLLSLNKRLSVKPKVGYWGKDVYVVENVRSDVVRFTETFFDSPTPILKLADLKFIE